MSEKPLEAHLRYYGISPWEIEVLYGYFNSRFLVIPEEIEPNDSNFVSSLDVFIPLPFTEAFFKWFEFKRWEKVKALFKEMKRRRGSGNAIKIQINFTGTPAISFVIDVKDRQWYNNAVEKMDFVLELLPYHLEPTKIPENTNHVLYRFDEEAKRWRLSDAFGADKRFVLKENKWRVVT